jgi:hypothetical protein
MNPRKFLVSVGIAVTALLPNNVRARGARVEPPSLDSPKESPIARFPGEDIKDPKQLTDPIVERLTYRSEAEQHLLLLRKPRGGNVYADHSSHGSHGSHGSHSSGN